MRDSTSAFCRTICWDLFSASKIPEPASGSTLSAESRARRNSIRISIDSGKAAVAFSLYPTTLDQLMDIADAGKIMPPKSTWFEPKLRDGLVIHNF